MTKRRDDFKSNAKCFLCIMIWDLEMTDFSTKVQ